MLVRGIADRRARTARGVVLGAVAAALLGVAGCGSPPAPPPPDPVTTAYCDTVARVQREQAVPGAGAGGVAASAAATRRQLADLVRTAPPEIAADWRGVQALTERSLLFIEATRGDPSKIDRAVLDRLKRGAEPGQARIRAFTEQRCGVTLRPPG